MPIVIKKDTSPSYPNTWPSSKSPENHLVGKLSQQRTGKQNSSGVSTLQAMRLPWLCRDNSPDFILLNKQADIISTFILLLAFPPSWRNQGSCLLSCTPLIRPYWVSRYGKVNTCFANKWIHVTILMSEYIHNIWLECSSDKEEIVMIFGFLVH